MRVACIATKGFEDHELADPVEALRAAGHRVDLIAPKREEIAGYHGSVKLRPDLSIDEAKAGEYDALFIPGGYSPDQLRADERFLRFAQAFKDKLIFALCHGPQLLFTAGLLDGRRVTAWRTVQDDLKRGGVDVYDQEVVVDGNLVTSRQPSDIPAFSRTIVAMIDRGVGHVPKGAEPGIPVGAPIH